MNIGDSYNIGVETGNARSPSPDFPTDEQTLKNRFDSPPWTLLDRPTWPQSGPPPSEGEWTLQRSAYGKPAIVEDGNAQWSKPMT